MKKIGLSWVGLLAALSVSGCIVEITFDPIGTDATMAGQWTVNGAAPTQASCDALGVSHVRVRFFDGTRGVDHPDLVFPCAQGSFDTSPNAVVADGVWTVALVAVAADGTAVGTAPQETFDTIVEGGHIVLTTVNFESTSTVTTLAGAWTINGAAPTAASCTELGATEVHVQFLDGTGTPGDDTLKLPCADGSFMQEMEPGAYNVRVVAVDSAQGAIAMAEPQAVTLTQGMTTTLTTVNFDRPAFDPTGTDSILTASWTIGGSTAAIADQCAAVGGADIELVFYSPDDEDFEDPFVFELGACGTGTFTSTTPALAAGTYVVDAYLWAPTGDEPISFVELGDITVTAGTAFDTGAIDFRLDASTIVANIGWEGPVGSEGNGVFGTCTASTVGTMSWVLWQGPVGTGTMVATSGATDPACAETFSIDAATAGGEIAAGTYALQVQGAPTSDPTRKNWVSSCDVTVGTSGGLSLVDCDISYME